MPDAFAVPAFDWGRVAETVEAVCTKEEEVQRKRLHVRRREEIIEDTHKASRDCIGDVRLQKLRETLDQFKKEPGNEYLIRSEQQKIFHLWFIQALLPHMYGSDWEFHMQRVMKEYPTDNEGPSGKKGIDRVRPEVLCITPRRYGKTWGISMIVAAALLCIPGIRIAVFSTGKRASQWLMRKVIKFIKDIPGGSERIVRQNQEELFLSDIALSSGSSQNSSEAKNLMNKSGTSEFYSFPSSVDGKCFLYLECRVGGCTPSPSPSITRPIKHLLHPEMAVRHNGTIQHGPDEERNDTPRNNHHRRIMRQRLICGMYVNLDDVRILCAIGHT